MTEWIRRSERVHVVNYSRLFEWADMPGAGFSFDCDENGNLLTNADGETVSRWGEVWHPAASDNYQMCLRGVGDGEDAGRQIFDLGVQRYEHSYTEPGVIRCSTCSGEVELNMVMTNTCDNCRTCGQRRDFSWHLLTAEQCEAWMRDHTGGERGCSREDEHHEFTECATDYNSSGQRLAPREQWGWDTGESVGDILQSDWPVGVSREAWLGMGDDE